MMSGTLGPHTVSQSSSAAPSYFPESQQWSEISSLSKVNLVLGKARSHRAPNLVCSGAESPGWFDVLPKHSVQHTMHEWVCCRDEAANHQLPIAVAFGIIWIVSVDEYSSLMQNLMQICCSARSVILNVTATQYICSFNGVYHPPLTSTVKLSLFMHAHSRPLSLAARLHRWCANRSGCVNNGC